MKPNNYLTGMHQVFLARAAQEDGCVRCGRNITDSFARKKNKKYICRCLFIVSPAAETPMNKSRLPIETWFAIIRDVLQSESGVSIAMVENRYGLSNTASWNLLHKIRNWINQVEEKESIPVSTRFIKISQGLKEIYALKYGAIIPPPVMMQKMLQILPPLFGHIKNKIAA